jgi:DNA-binding NarL/FixJ family response regulator
VRRGPVSDPRSFAEALRFLPQAAWEALRSSGADAAARAQLTATERRICGLVARGLTNKEIAGRLVVAPSTVHTHLKRIFKKLGVHSRAELAVWASRCRIDEPANG